MKNKALSILKKYWGYDSFLPNQESIIKSIFEQKDTVALIPTGGGKSLCFQIPALALEGTCIVISPLIALIDDQIQRLKSLDIPAEGLHSGLDKTRKDDIIAGLFDGRLKLLYISPEKLQSEKFRKILERIKLSFIAVDEAHCISQWGYDFRPDYLKISNIKELFPGIPIAAFTATANKKTLKDIIKHLDLNRPKVIKGSFLKSNLSFGVIETEKKIRVLNLLLKEFDGSGIIYMRSRRGTVFLADLLKKNGENVSYYHAGMNPESRRKVQSDWLNNKVRVIVSTTAFGMGIDKPDVRFVIHFDLPGSIEEYYQETGRAGRDGKKSDVVLVYNKNDLSVLKKNNLDTFPHLFDIKTTYNRLLEFCKIDINDSKSNTVKIDLEEFYSYNKLDKFKTYKCLKELERYGIISMNIPIQDIFSQLKFNFQADFLDKLRIQNEDKYQVLYNANLIYEGLFISHTKISEERIAKKAGMDTQLVVKLLEEISEDKIVVYNRQKLRFSITFLQKSEIFIDEKELSFRKKIMESNINSIFEYLSYKKCRQKFILKYFDEKLRKTCKICDICSGVANTIFSKAEFINFKKTIEGFQFNKNTDIDDLMFVDTYQNRNKNFEMLKRFFEMGFLVAQGNKIIKNE